MISLDINESCLALKDFSFKIYCRKPSICCAIMRKSIGKFNDREERNLFPLLILYLRITRDGFEESSLSLFQRKRHLILKVFKY